VASLYRRLLTTALLVSAIAVSGCSGAARSHGSGDRRASREGKGDHGDAGELPVSAEIARLRIERDRLAQSKELLEQELAEAHDDLRNVERQFAVYEERLVSEQGKAAAVAAAAEARIRCDRLARERPSVLADSMRLYVTDLLETSDRLIQKQNYAAAQFYAERANHTMSSAQRRATIEGAATTRTVSVDAANVRQGPGQSYSVVERLHTGALLLCWGETNDWYHVKTPNGVEGWIHASLVR